MSAINFSKGGVVLTLLALLIFAASVAGVDRRVLKPMVNKDLIYSSYKRSSDTCMAAGNLLAKHVVSSLDGKYIIPEVVPIQPPDTNSGDGSVAAKELETDTVRVTGIMKTRDENYQAIVNNTIVRSGSVIYGFIKVLDITENLVTFEINGKTRELKINDEIPVTAQTSQPLDVQEIVVRDGVWVALINGSYYRSGDWIDKQTQVKVVTPTTVMILRAGKMIVHRP